MLGFMVRMFILHEVLLYIIVVINMHPFNHCDIFVIMSKVLCNFVHCLD